ncbi:esterase YqiA [Vibrio porteresiae]|uniref:Esterase YqiA n=1 Tax=Vibrio porteresiae DSM 19223 TaxID=1123496 RepID=A0ABZ0QB75_9VIBR|nr:esterase YqiA [Vibrio porteresiae]WPC73694.1 esterase YqiA [Vibrio porteresiae DSM 19223]
MSKPSMLMYIHGFNSSPLSHKAQVMLRYCEEHRPDIKVVVPKLPNYPQEAALYLEALMDEYQANYQIGLVGSSLGGYFSAWLHQKYGVPAVLVNPAVKPYELLVDYLGLQENPYTHERYELKERHMYELKALDCLRLPEPNRVWILSQTNDEVLDYQQAITKYSDAVQTVEQGGDHSFVNFERYPEKIVQFLNL